MKVLLTGATGLLGTHLIKTVPNNIEIVGTIHTYKKTIPHPRVTYLPIDIRDKKSVDEVVKLTQPEVIIHTAAHTSVDYCEKNKDDTTQTNSKGVQHIADAARKVQAKVLFCSTNMTYDGLKPPYTEKSKQNPNTFYGKTKVIGEKILENAGINYTVIRLMTMYGWNWQPQRKNMVSMSIEKLKNNEKLWMTNDVFNNLLYVGQAAQFFWKIIQNPDKTERQKFNIAGSECLNRYQAVMNVCEAFGFRKDLVTEVSSDYFAGSEVPRSPNTCFDTTTAHNKLGFIPFSLKQGLLAMKDAA